MLDGISEMGMDSMQFVGTEKSLSGQKLPDNWPQISGEEEAGKVYDTLYDPNDDKAKPPSHAHIDRLSYELKSGDKKLRYFAVFHQRDMSGSDDPNLVQYDELENRFIESPPQLVLYEGFIDDVNHPLKRDDAINLGEPAFMAYLVQQHNAHIKEGEKQIAIESADYSVNTLPNSERDPQIVKNIADKFGKFDRIDIVMGSGHAIREKAALEQLFQ